MMYCDCITVILFHNLLSFKYYWNESIQILLQCSRTITLLLLLTETIQELYSIKRVTMVLERTSLSNNRVFKID